MRRTVGRASPVWPAISLSVIAGVPGRKERRTSRPRASASMKSGPAPLPLSVICRTLLGVLVGVVQHAGLGDLRVHAPPPGLLAHRLAQVIDGRGDLGAGRGEVGVDQFAV